MPEGPHVPGFGMTLLRGIIEHELGGECRTTFSDDGICWVLLLPLGEIEADR